LREQEFIRLLDSIREGTTEPHILREFLTSVASFGLPHFRTASLALAIADSGPRLATRDLGLTSNVHSTGGPGSLSTLLAPILVAAAGFSVPLLSVQSSVAGAIDSLKAIPGYKTHLGPEQVREVVRTAGLSHIGHGTAGFAPADSVLWSYRAETGTKKIPELIAASLLGKQVAMGVRHGSVDIRVGVEGNAGKSLDAATETARVIIGVASILGMRINCTLSNLHSIQWSRIGRIDAVLSTWEILSEPANFLAHPHVRDCILIAACACHASAPSTELSAWIQQIATTLRNRRALALFERSIAAHGAAANARRESELQAVSRPRVHLKIANEPTPTQVSAWFKKMRALVKAPADNALGIELSENGTVVLSVPAECADLLEKAKATLEECVMHCKTDEIDGPGFKTTILSYDHRLFHSE